MANVIAAANNSGASVFDMFNVATNTATQLIRTAGQGVAMLDAKTSLLHDRVQLNCKLQRIVMTDEEILAAADQHADLMEASHKKNYPGSAFDRSAFHAAAVVKMRQAAEAA